MPWRAKNSVWNPPKISHVSLIVVWQKEIFIAAIAFCCSVPNLAKFQTSSIAVKHRWWALKSKKCNWNSPQDQGIAVCWYVLHFDTTSNTFALDYHHLPAEPKVQDYFTHFRPPRMRADLKSKKSVPGKWKYTKHNLSYQWIMLMYFFLFHCRFIIHHFRFSSN